MAVFVSEAADSTASLIIKSLRKLFSKERHKRTFETKIRKRKGSINNHKVNTKRNVNRKVVYF